MKPNENVDANGGLSKIQQSRLNKLFISCHDEYNALWLMR